MAQQPTTLIAIDAKQRLPENPMSQLGSTNIVPQISSEGYKLVDKLIDPEALYLNKLTVFLIGCNLIKKNTISTDDVIPGYSLAKIKGAKANLNMQGYTTITHEILMALNADGSVTRFPKEFMLERFAARQTMSIISMMCSNKDDWEFTNYTMIYPFGLTLWKAIVAVLSRSRAEEGKLTLLDKLIHPALWLTQGGSMNEEKPRSKWFQI